MSLNVQKTNEKAATHILEQKTSSRVTSKKKKKKKEILCY